MSTKAASRSTTTRPSALRAVALYSLLGMAAMNGIDPMAYLREVLARIADHSINRIQDLLPWNLASPCNEQAA